MRSWLAMTAAFALALQMLLGGILMAQAAGGTPDGLSTICTSDGSAPSDHGSGKTANHEICVFCTLAKAAHAVLPADTAVSRLDVRLLAIIGPEPAAQISEFHSPTGRYQRGPPRAPVAG
jgi:hypothetical protein